ACEGRFIVPTVRRSFNKKMRIFSAEFFVLDPARATTKSRPLLAQSGHTELRCKGPLSGVKRTSAPVCDP
ncbi:MAG: hypothetical protein WB504_01645, partial [Pseudolabrys sp.]